MSNRCQNNLRYLNSRPLHWGWPLPAGDPSPGWPVFWVSSHTCRNNGSSHNKRRTSHYTCKTAECPLTNVEYFIWICPTQRQGLGSLARLHFRFSLCKLIWQLNRLWWHTLFKYYPNFILWIRTRSSSSRLMISTHCHTETQDQTPTL